VASPVEQEVSVRHHAFEYTDGVDDRGDGDPGDCALHSGGLVVAVVVGRGLVFVAVDQVPFEVALGVGLGVGAAAGPQAQDYWWRALIPTVRYSSPDVKS
jgi:hypothetical protein